MRGAPKRQLNKLDAQREYDEDKAPKVAMELDSSASYVNMTMQERHAFTAHFSRWEKDNTLDI